MLRGESIVAGTSTTGTGTLTLAAIPSAVGGVDFNAWLKSTGIGFVSGNAIPVSYTIIEYTTSTFTVPKFVEKGIGTLTLGASITAATLARTTVQTVSNANANTYQVGAGATAITIGTAANTLVFVGASAADLMAFPPYFETSLGDALGVPPPHTGTGGGAASANLVSGQDYFFLFQWQVPMLVKKATMNVQLAYATGSPVSNADARIYAVNSSGRPGKLLLDLGLLGAAGTSLNATGNISSAVHASGFYLTPGEYYFDFLPVFSGATTLPQMKTMSGTLINSSRSGYTAGANPQRPAYTQATGGTIGAAPDPANSTSYALAATATVFSFLLNSS